MTSAAAGSNRILIFYRPVTVRRPAAYWRSTDVPDVVMSGYGLRVLGWALRIIEMRNPGIPRP